MQHFFVRKNQSVKTPFLRYGDCLAEGPSPLDRAEKGEREKEREEEGGKECWEEIEMGEEER